MALRMHCKRFQHEMSNEKRSKLPANYAVILVPLFSTTKKKSTYKPILPKTSSESSSAFEVLKSLSNRAILKNTLESKPGKSTTNVKRKRSAECQTVRKRNRPAKNFELKSIETQTLYSSFDLKSSEQRQKNVESINNNKCSSFTQTLIDEQDLSNGLIDKDLFLPSKLNETNKSDFDSEVFESYNTTETQTNFGADFEDLDLPLAAMANEEEKFKFTDLEFIDIETQTNWNYDRTTQTEDEMMIENWYMHLWY